ncbi:TetR/AcrR family transcriptional regulator [Galactobacter caseinivorans]|nr:TetR/AcrR family transcriptional regulator [Galactobacter caseinivorans]
MESRPEAQRPSPSPEGGDRSEATRARILTMATEVFLEHGGSVSMDRMAAEIDVSKVTIYKHFGSKLALLFACIEHRLDISVEFFNSLGGSGLAAYPTLRVAFESMTYQWIEALAQPGYLSLRTMVYSEALRSPEIAQLWAERGPSTANRLAERLLKGLVKAGLLKIDDMELAVIEISTVMLGPDLLRAQLGRPPTPELTQRLVKHAVEMYLTAYATVPMDAPLHTPHD